MKGLWWRLRIVWLCLRGLGDLHLGTHVIYRGHRCVLYQGVSDPLWKLADAKTGQPIGTVHRKDFRRIRSVSNYLHDFRFMYRFYMTSWFRIWREQGIKPWMRRCAIWPKGRRGGGTRKESPDA